MILAGHIEPLRIARCHVKLGEEGGCNAAIVVILPGLVLIGDVFGFVFWQKVPDQPGGRGVNVIQPVVDVWLQLPQLPHPLAGLEGGFDLTSQ